MAKNVAGQRPKSGNGAGNGPAPEQPESLDQVRDILFGGQMRMVDARLRSLEERIVLEQTTLRNDLIRKITELEEASRHVWHQGAVTYLLPAPTGAEGEGCWHRVRNPGPGVGVVHAA